MIERRRNDLNEYFGCVIFFKCLGLRLRKNKKVSYNA